MSVPALNHIPRSLTSLQHFGIKGEKGIDLKHPFSPAYASRELFDWGKSLLSPGSAVKDTAELWRHLWTGPCSGLAESAGRL